MAGAAPDTLAGLRDRALLLLGFAGALRRSELVALNVDDLEAWAPPRRNRAGEQPLLDLGGLQEFRVSSLLKCRKQGHFPKNREAIAQRRAITMKD